MTFPVVLLVGIIAFSLVQITPGDPALAVAGDSAPPEVIRRFQAKLGTDQPFITQFRNWVLQLAQGDLGTSLFSDRSVWALIAPRIEPTLSIAIQTVILSTLIGVTAGVLAAWQAGRILDRVIMFLAVLGFSVPGFFIGTLAIWVFVVHWEVFPILGFTRISEGGLLNHLHSLALPVIISSVLGAALKARIARSSMLEVLNEDFIRTARSKGLTERVVYMRHALRAASIPIVTILGFSVAAALTGAVITETLFAIPGLGRLMVESIARRDYPIIQALLMLSALVYLIVNLVIDIFYAYLDPRIRYV